MSDIMGVFIFVRYGALTFGDEQDIVPDSVSKSKFEEIQKLYAKQTARVSRCKMYLNLDKYSQGYYLPCTGTYLDTSLILCSQF